jgi:hypothetical protein
MTTSVQYWRMPEEEADMVAFLQSIRPTMALPVRRVATVEELVWQPIAQALRESDPAFLITPLQFVSAMELHHNADGFAASVPTTPALYYSRGHITAQQMSSTALSAQWVDHRPEFVRWGKKVMQWVRQVAPDWSRYKHHRITRKAEAARQAGLEMVF